MEVDIISKETIKPNVATPSDKKNLRFSLLDQKHPPILVPTLLFYSAPYQDVSSVSVTPLGIITRLKTCLSQTLSVFYPLAGRYETWGTCLCNDEGIPLFEARVNRPLRDVVGSLSSSSSDVELRCFFPPNKDELITSGIHLAIQINVFSCGGFAIGWYHTHKVTDGVSAATFLRHWAGLVTQRYEAVAPDFKAGAIAYPPVPEEDRLLERDPQANKVLTMKQVVVRSFVFNNAAVAKLKAQAASEKVPNPSRFTAVVGFVWQQILLASPTSNYEGVKPSIVYQSVDLRSRTDPALPKESMGNLVEMALARCNDKRAPVLSALVAELNVAISEMKDVAAELQGDKRSEAFEKHRQVFVKEAREYEWRDVYIITSWCKSAGFSDIDFGFGTPLWVVPTDESVLHKADMAIITDSTDSLGDAFFEVWFFLGEQHMKILQSNPHFLALASPRF